MFKGWSAKIGASALWFLSGLLSIVILFVGGDLYQLFILVTLNVSRWSNTMWLNLYYYVAGVLWLGLIVFSQSILFNASALAGAWLKRGLFICGLELVGIACLHLGVAVYQPFQAFTLLLIVAEFLAGGWGIWYARRIQPAKN